MPITALYAAILTPLFIVLSARVIRARHSGRVPIGDGGDKELLRRIRVHANFAEYVPLALILMGLAESLKADPWYLNALGAVLVLGRVLHAVGVSSLNERFALRTAGMSLTFAVLAGAALACLIGVVWR